ncbi:MAG TPA: RdgB/HAM1 family non-canonical purine NTP pyrophosphatase [Pirellulaceae bacterium]|nr:RdgB/HAM1 family non-canonical purine NTP pyrophosphatase [Pirellulaceae bacterium]
MSQILVLGTRNRKKCVELEPLLAPYGFQLLTLADLPQAIEVEETGTTFAANAALKASQQALHLKQWVLGEDSGLEVEALRGAPGVYSARYAGTQGDDEANNRLLLDNLREVPLERRSARYVCHIALSDPTGQIHASVEEYCRGRILLERRGSAGFGYDPMFEVIEYHRTFGELGLDVKSVLSHRSRAVRQFVPKLLALLASGAFAHESTV